MNNTAIIILAAGSSLRFGSAKQLLHFNNKTLLQHVIDEAIESGAEPIVVVTGANADKVSKEIKDDKVEIVFNNNWKEGMASGIIAGLKRAITLNNDIENVIITVCDQPFISSVIFQQLYETQNENVKHIVACSYADTIGTPVLFKQKYFDALMSLQGDEGAKKILLANKDDVATINFPQGNIDIDSQDDYKNLLDKQRHVL
jgi:molybdenum cofactor cytidylyltransferase